MPVSKKQRMLREDPWVVRTEDLARIVEEHGITEEERGMVIERLALCLSVGTVVAGQILGRVVNRRTEWTPLGEADGIFCALGEPQELAQLEVVRNRQMSGRALTEMYAAKLDLSGIEPGRVTTR